MSDNFDNGTEALLGIFIFETNQLLEQLEEILLESEKHEKISTDDIEEIFRIMHTIKGSAAMMKYQNIASVSHAVEDLFDIIRKNPNVDYSKVYDVVFSALDFIKAEINSIENGGGAGEGKPELLDGILHLINLYKGDGKEVKSEKKANSSKGSRGSEKIVLNTNKQIKEDVSKYYTKVFFEDGCQMENVHAFSVVFNIQDKCSELYYRPHDIMGDNDSAEYIAKNGFDIYYSTDLNENELNAIFANSIMVKDATTSKVNKFDIDDIKEYFSCGNETDAEVEEPKISSVEALENEKEQGNTDKKESAKNSQSGFLNVSTEKVDKLLDLVEEIVISESMVSKNPDLEGLSLENFNNSARKLKKLLIELESSVLSMRMVPVSLVFQRLNRIVRDMSKKLEKEVELQIKGEETEVDKNIVNSLSDPMLHLIRNSMDHGIETPEERIKKGKKPKGKILISAKNDSGEVIIRIIDDGAGLDRHKIIKKAKELGIAAENIDKLDDKDVFSYILHPGFSTKKEVTEFSGRGVGMDVVRKNIEEIGGSIVVRSEFGKGTAIIIKIPLTLSIIYAMKIEVGQLIFSVPTFSVKEFFRADKKDLIKDTDGAEMILFRGECYPILRLHKHFNINNRKTDLSEGIMIMIEEQGEMVCLFADSLLGEQHIVVKPIPDYLMQYPIKDTGLVGCTILSDGGVSFIIDTKSIINRNI